MLSGDNSILQKATDAKTNTERTTVIELAQTDILGQIAENKGKNITKEQLRAVLNKYFENTESTTIPDEVSTTNDISLITTDEKYTIKLSEIYKGTFSNSDNQYKVYEDNFNGAIALLDINTGKPTTFEKVYVMFDGQKMSILDIKNHDSNYYYEYNEETHSEIGESLEWDYVFIPDIFVYYDSFEEGTYEFIIEKNNKEYKGIIFVEPAS